MCLNFTQQTKFEALPLMLEKNKAPVNMVRYSVFFYKLITEVPVSIGGFILCLLSTTVKLLTTNCSVNWFLVS